MEGFPITPAPDLVPYTAGEVRHSTVVENAGKARTWVVTVKNAGGILLRVHGEGDISPQIAEQISGLVMALGAGNLQLISHVPVEVKLVK